MQASSRRDAALIPLSHDHHHALVIAMLLRRATDATAPGTCQAFLDFWQHECSAHFRIEEEVLFPAYAEHAGKRDALLLRALDDHAEIRRRADELGAAEPPSGARLNELGEQLAAHVRLEERELFPAIEQTLPPERLAAVGVALAEADRTLGG
jgi:iron-sulfur cluster repair protein YtfE (RIC family)